MVIEDRGNDAVDQLEDPDPPDSWPDGPGHATGFEQHGENCRGHGGRIAQA